MDSSPDAHPERIPTQWSRWIRRGAAALADQGLFAVGNFLLNVLLARWLSARDYGAFTVAFSVFLLFGTLHTAALTEPMLVFAPGKWSHQFTEYVRSLLRLHWWGAAIGSAALIILAGLDFLFGNRALSGSFLALSVSGPIILLTWLARRACYARLQPELAAMGGGAYLVTMIVFLFALRSAEIVNPMSAVLAMGAAGLVSLVVLIPALGIKLEGIGGSPVDPIIAQDHWNYGKWALATAILGWIPTNLFVLVLPLGAGLEASGAFRALLNLFIPMMHAISALGILALPAMVKVWTNSSQEYGRLVGRLAATFAVVAALYGLTIALFGRALIDWLYASKYAAYAPVIGFLAPVPAFAGLAAVFGSALRAVERPDLVFRAYLFPAIAAISVGAFLSYFHGVSGASLGWLVTYAVAAASLAAFYLMWFSRSRTENR